MMRHGESMWNSLNLFTGWVDVPLSKKGIDESLEGGKLIKDIPIDLIFTSTLIRAQMTAMLVMSIHSQEKTPVIQHPDQGALEGWGKIYNPQIEKKIIPVFCASELNERMYGELQGLNKAETMEKFGTEQVKIWRRSYDMPPPEGESLEMTTERTLPYFNQTIMPYLRENQTVFISAHGNSIRAITKEIEGISDTEIVNVEIPTGIPILYEYNIDSEEFRKISL